MFDAERGSIARWLAVLVVVLVAVLGTAGIALWLAGDRLQHSLGANSLAPAPPPSEFGTRHDIGTRGDEPNPGALFRGAYPSDEQTQERHIGELPARFSGYTTWIRSVTTVPAHRFVDGYSGRYLRARVEVFNRDTEIQHVCGCDFYVWTRKGGLREADVVTGQTVSPDGNMKSGARRQGDVYLYVGAVPGPYYIVYNPDSHVFLSGGSARGVWRVTL
ncbi:MAG: hypothetical protein QOI44_188 [Actinomycetota bacterium]|nr:hypothetical protein [Actinomycetota bacterium]